MSPLPRNTIQHFTHPKHSLTLFDSNTKYSCDGCKILGIGKRYHCSKCDFDLHEYCGTCPMKLSSFLHPYHSLKLVNRKPQGERRLDRFCNVCCDSIEGLFYRCEVCEFDVHPLCTQLPETLRHALHQVHPLKLLGSTESGTCVICRGACNASSWRYRCIPCGFDIHIDCVTIQCEKKTTTDRGIPTYVPPSGFDGYAYGIPYYHPSPLNMHHNYVPQPNHQNHGQVQTHHGGGRIGQVMFGLVKTLGTGVLSNMIFGTDLSSFFAT
ncbi:uncharacterized protein [Solanum tuberosum]|uniref:DC1 domain-containing protein n=1 Tax=Solanum tuberosum TaxID=4113 RepID=M1AH48_SOLTU|nr:PREDICTED: uncharacterized protein LOC102604803 [Solanum tuberosum]